MRDYIKNIVKEILLLEAQTKSGKEIEFERGFAKENVHMFPWIVLQIDAKIDGQKIGYIKIEYIPKENWDKAYPTILDFIARKAGKVALQDLDKEPKIKQLERLYLSLNWRFSESSIKDRSIDELIDNALAALERRYLEDYHETEFFHVDKPFVAFIDVNEEWRREGIGTALYIEATKWMKERGLLFRGSGIQSPEAQATWKHMKKKMHYKKEPATMYIPMDKPQKFRYALDPNKLDKRKSS